MLSKKQIAELREAVERVDLGKALKDAKDMGIEVTTKELGFHGMYNVDGNLEKIDMDKHFKIGKREEIKTNTQNETFDYSFEQKETEKVSSVERDIYLVV